VINIQKAEVSDIKAIQAITQISWVATYAPILSEEQLEYMLTLFYSEKALLEQIQMQQQVFYLVLNQDNTIGFFSIEHQYKKEQTTRIHKIYLLPETQGKGIGKQVLDKVTEMALENQSQKLSLNVNRFNKALYFYQKLGFESIGEEDIAIGNGYLMQDFRMQKKI
jgi:diamine N-acetyltransferase